MKISSKLLALSLGTVAVIGGLSMALVSQLRSLTTQYNEILQGPVREAEAARATQVDFKKQVQEWKDILLRGHNPDDLTKYTSQFHEQEAKVKTEAQTLAATVKEPETRQLLIDFLSADEILSAKYQQAYGVYVKGNFDFKAADKLVRGQDRPPTDLFDKVVSLLNARVNSTIAAQQAQSTRQRNIALVISGTFLVLISLVGFLIVRSVLMRLDQLKAVSDRLAHADVAGLSINISGNDEVGEFGQSLKGVAAAIEELLALAPR